MKTQDDERWRAQKAELGQQVDAQSAHTFIEFVEDWCGRAEEVLGNSELLAIDALRITLAPTEERHGFLSTSLLANMLLVICANWEYGQDTLFESMTEFEQRLVVDVAGMITSEMQASAEGEAVPDEFLTLKYGQKVPTGDA
jgi:hypothetical protein